MINKINFYRKHCLQYTKRENETHSKQPKFKFSDVITKMLYFKNRETTSLSGKSRLRAVQFTFHFTSVCNYVGTASIRRRCVVACTE